MHRRGFENSKMSHQEIFARDVGDMTTIHTHNAENVVGFPMSASTENFPDTLSDSEDEGIIIDNKKTSPPLTLFGFSLSHVSHSTRLTIGTGGTLFFYILYGYLQEWLFSEPGFRFSLFVTLMQFLTFATLSRLDLFYQSRLRTNDPEPEATVPYQTYGIMGVLLVLAFGLSNVSLLYLTYPTKVVLKASKLVAVMPLGLVVLNKTYSGRQYLSAGLLVIGVILFTLSDRIVHALQAPGTIEKLPPKAIAAGGMVTGAHELLLGFLSMAASLIADSLLGNLQERTLDRYHCSPQDLVYHNSLVAFGTLSVVTLLSGELLAAVTYCLAHPTVFFRTLFLVFVGYLGVSTYLVVVKTSGIFVATMVATVRKFFTILLSFLLFPKPFSWAHALGLFCVFGGVLLNSTGKRTRNFTTPNKTVV